MKKQVSIILILALLIPFMFNFITSAAPTLPTASDLNGYENICLTYTFGSSYDKDRIYTYEFEPYVAYIDAEGNKKDYFFDSFLFLPRMGYGPSGARMHIDLSNPTKAIDWTTYIEDTFQSGYNVDALNNAFLNAKNALNDESDKKAGAFFTILYPAATATNFGELGGRSLNFSNMEDRKYAVKWMIDEQVSLFNDKEYEGLELVGFYWLEEYLVENKDVELIKYTAEYLHSLGLKFIWIPWYKATGYNRGDELGFDAVCMQPNLFFQAYTDPNRVNDSIKISNRYGMGMEIEVDFDVFDDYYFNRYLYYLSGGLNSEMINSVKMYYQDAGPGVYYTACTSSDKRYRDVYDLTYKYAKGTLTQAEIDALKPADAEDNFVDDINMPYIVNGGVDWISIGKSYTTSKDYYDGSGAGYQNISGKELTDGKIAKVDLGTDWIGYHDKTKDSDGRFNITIDLGEVRDDITNFAAHFDNKQLYSIGSPGDLQIAISTTGRTFTTILRPELTLDPNESGFWVTCNPVKARYVRLSFKKLDKSFVFCSEFLVGTGEAVPLSTVSFNANGGTGTMADATDVYCDYKLPSCKFTAPEGKQFKAWIVNETEYAAGDTIYVTEDITVTAIWEDIPEPEYILGDVNNNGKIDARDYLLLKRGYFGTFTLDELAQKSGDINNNGKIDARDYLLLKRGYFGTYTIK